MTSDQRRNTGLGKLFIKFLIPSCISLFKEGESLHQEMQKELTSSFKSSNPSFIAIFTFCLQSNTLAILDTIFCGSLPKE